MKERFNPKSIARTALAASLPLAAGLSACGDRGKPTDSLQPYLKAYADAYGGAIGLEVSGLPPEKTLSVVLLREDLEPNQLADSDFKIYTVEGVSSGATIVSILPVTSCEGTYSIKTINPDSEAVSYPVKGADGAYHDSFVLEPDCTKVISIKAR